MDEGPALLPPLSVMLPPLASISLIFIKNTTARAADICLILYPVMKLDSGMEGGSSPSSSASTLYLEPLTSLYLNVWGNYLIDTSHISITVLKSLQKG